ncbi:hypothetical protein GTW78_17405, partial [Streptomyces sp. SID4948]|nr:hypothetical protein [Streptomyces sp. SID4948]
MSCYTANLIGHLARADPGADARFAGSVELSVREDGPDGVLAFRHYGRIAPDLGYRSARGWDEAGRALRAEFGRRGDVLVVANSRHLPWSVHRDRRDVPHWVRLAGRDGDRWLVVDDFEALLPEGAQAPYRGWVDEEGLRSLAAPLPDLPAVLRQRDLYALGGGPAFVPDVGTYRWLEHGAGRYRPDDSHWVLDTRAALAYVRDRFAADVEAMRAHADDLWAAARHHCFRAAHGTPDPSAAAAWGELARALRFAVQSADRGRPRPALV